MKRLDYPLQVEPLPVEDGGGYVAYAPDLPGCMSDADSPEQAVSNLRDAIEVWLATARAAGIVIPQPALRRSYA